MTSIGYTHIFVSLQKESDDNIKRGEDLIAIFDSRGGVRNSASPNYTLV